MEKRGNQPSLKELIAIVTGMGIIALIYPLITPSEANFRTNSGNVAKYSSNTLGVNRPMIKVLDNISNLKEVFSVEGLDSLVYHDSTGRRYLITNGTYSTSSRENPDSLVTGSLDDGDSLSNFLTEKTREYWEYNRKIRKSIAGKIWDWISGSYRNQEENK